MAWTAKELQVALIPRRAAILDWNYMVDVIAGSGFPSCCAKNADSIAPSNTISQARPRWRVMD